ncbi:MAG TPA: acetate--CoA ligase family protein [Candidatus Polarisedimenticolaceae bacterium]
MRALVEDPYALAAELGLKVPPSVLVRDAAHARGLDLKTPRVVVKAVSSAIVHKTEAGAVAIVPAERAAEAVAAMEARLAAFPVEGYRIFACVEHERSFGRELLLGMRWTEDFGPVVTLAAGGVHAEHLARSFVPGADVAILSPVLAGPAVLERALRATAVGPLLLDGLRGRPPLIGRDALLDLLARALAFARENLPGRMLDFEINPLVVTDDGLFALDARAAAGRARGATPPERPIEKIGRLLRPRSIAIAGVSSRRNPGRVILENVLAEGFDPAHVRVIKPGARDIDGIPCVPSVAGLEPPVDLLVLSVDAVSGVEAIEQACETGRAESVVLIPGGLGEREGTEALESRLRSALASARARGIGPVVNGGNCLGVRSAPGRYDTMFIPGVKLGREPLERREAAAPLSVVSQSGAFACARATTLGGVEPRHLISIGNQIDLTAGDYLRWLKDDAGTEIVACYVEGFRPLDGAAWIEAAAGIVASGRDVILYRAGRTAEGAGAAASHTAAIAGDFAVLRALARQAGVVLAETVEDFDDLVRLFVRLRGRRLAGARLGAMSNAGFECVAFGDALGPFAFARFAPGTASRLAAILDRARLSGIVAPHNPFDATPILPDAPFGEAVEAILDDPGVDAAIVGCVPMTPALATLAAEGGPDDVASRLGSLFAATAKPWVAVVDGGPPYDAMRARLERAGIPVFRTADRALRLLGLWAEVRMRAERPSPPCS